MIVIHRANKGGQFVGNWRIHAPRLDDEVCTACGLCASFCPEAAISTDEEGKPEIDWRFCKGCGICANECPTGAMTMVKEE
ncbi:MAG: 4Fe-4S binding protein [Candidatus Bathyarchaeota archaeon]|nr:MAG: 4Fe-4S binding protein [Candidatus Bathyarchaeota archaeon]